MQLEVVRSPEFMRFESWLKANPSLSPYRAEWSIYHEDWLVAGQIDSLWFETRDSNSIVMADWKRCRGCLSSDVVMQSRQSFHQRRGLASCDHAPGVPGPCRDMYDCAYTHYLVQQRLYAYIVASKYDVEVHRMLLLQCHPNVGHDCDSYHEEEIPSDPDGAFALEVLTAFDVGWKNSKR